MYYNPQDYQGYYVQQMQNLQQLRTVLDRVQGEAAAVVYPVQPGQEVILFDIDNPYVYRKSRGLDNKLEQQRFRLVEDVKDTEPKVTVNMDEYVKVSEIAQIVADAVDKKMSEYTLKPTKKAKTTEEE